MLLPPCGPTATADDRCTRVIVIDASVLATAVVDDGGAGVRARTRMRGEAATAPELIDAEVASALRRQVRSGALSADRAEAALADLVEYPLTRVGHRRLLSRAWGLRANVTIYDGLYVALAEMLDLILVTADARLSRAPGLRCAVDLVG